MNRLGRGREIPESNLRRGRHDEREREREREEPSVAFVK